MPNPTVFDGSPDAGQHGWKLHLVELGIETSKRFRGYVKPQTVDTSPALCGLSPAHGWGLDLFINDECERCMRVALRRGLTIPNTPR